MLYLIPRIRQNILKNNKFTVLNKRVWDFPNKKFQIQTFKILVKTLFVKTNILLDNLNLSKDWSTKKSGKEN